MLYRTDRCNGVAWSHRPKWSNRRHWCDRSLLHGTDGCYRISRRNRGDRSDWCHRIYWSLLYGANRTGRTRW